MKHKSLAYAIKATLPVLTGYLAAGFAFGLMYNQIGYNPGFAALTSATVYSGSLQFLAVDLMGAGASFLTIALFTIIVNSRHILYGISMIDKFKDMGWRKWYMIFALTDETYALLNHVVVPGDVDRKTFYFQLALLNHCYWIIGGTLGNATGELLKFNYKGVDFAMTALFIVTCVDQWQQSKTHLPALFGLGCTLAALLLFGADNMLIPAMAAIVILLLAFQKKVEGEPQV